MMSMQKVLLNRLLQQLVLVLLLAFSTVSLAGGSAPDKSSVPAKAASYYFPRHQISAGFYDHNLIDVYVNKYVSYPYVPIFWKGDAQAESGFILMYRQMFYHTKKYLSFNWGVSSARWKNGSEAQYTASLFLELRFWFLRYKALNAYFVYSIAGPSYLSRQHFDGENLGGHFSFQDYMGIGFVFGHRHMFNISAKIFHYSNGNMLPQNPGFDVPIVLSLGYSWS